MIDPTLDYKAYNNNTFQLDTFSHQNPSVYFKNVSSITRYLENQNVKDSSGCSIGHFVRLAAYWLVWIFTFGLCDLFPIKQKDREIKSDAEEPEYEIFCNLRRFSAISEETFSKEQRTVFLQTVKQVEGLFKDEIIKRHVYRIFENRNLNYSPWDTYQTLQGEEKKVVRLHEFSEMLFLKWEQGKEFDDPVQEEFFDAHAKAVKIENLYMISKAAEMGVSLTFKALEYTRLVDNSYIYCIYNEEGIENSIKTLTKNQENIPSISELENFVQFIIRSGVQQRFSTAEVYNVVWSRYFFTILYQKFQSYPADYSKVLLLVLYFNQTNQNFEKYPAQIFLNGLTKVFSELTSYECTQISYNFFDAMERIRKKERYCNYYLSKLITNLQDYIRLNTLTC